MAFGALGDVQLSRGFIFGSARRDPEMLAGTAGATHNDQPEPHCGDQYDEKPHDR